MIILRTDAKIKHRRNNADLKFTTDGLIIKETNVGESDRAVVALTRDKGKVSAFVSGARKPKSKNAAATARLSFSSLTFNRTKDTYRITESEAIEVFFGLRTDIQKLSLAQYICELCQVLVPFEVEGEDFLRLALNSLHFIAEGKMDIYAVKALTELRMMVIAGFMPDLVGCRNCGTDRGFPMFLDINGGDMLCNDCKASAAVQGNFAVLDRTTFAAMRHIAYSDFKRLYSFSLPPQNARYLSFVTERYLSAQTDHRFKTLDFFHSLETQM